MSDMRPCGGDAYVAMEFSDNTPSPNCFICSRYSGYSHRREKCLGPDGYRWMALVASEVAAEQDETLRLVESTLRRCGITHFTWIETQP